MTSANRTLPASAIQKKIWILVGTRPEVIKQAPVYIEAVHQLGRENVGLIGTGQHRELLDQALQHFNISLDHNLGVMRSGQSLSESSVAILSGMAQLFTQFKPDWLVVQGDTSSAAMAAWAAFQCGVRVAHNEAGLRSYDLQHPFPEEANRRLIAVVADLHFAPTEKARESLLKEGVPPGKIKVTGNTGIDALRMTLEMGQPSSVTKILDLCRENHLEPVLLTAHRRENMGEGMDQWFQALAQILRSHQNLALIYPIHPNNAARPAAEKHLAGLQQVFIMPAINYAETCHVLNQCRFVVTDSGGIQEEASAMGIPVVVCRKTTERSEAVEFGIAHLSGIETESILDGMAWAYKKSAFPRTSTGRLIYDLFGDGNSAKTIVNLLTNRH
jgi:UDP-N-acetylglucosamine 2-epimerase (non-hydrolysing)